MNDDEMTDAERIEFMRERMQAAFERAIVANLEGKSLDEFYESDPLESKTMIVAAIDLREIGWFDLVMPPGVSLPRRHWVYVRKADDAVFALSWRSRRLLLEQGFVDVPVMVDDPSKQN
jgi:hypothetical protein